jgi:hypothetical protein
VAEALDVRGTETPMAAYCSHTDQKALLCPAFHRCYTHAETFGGFG